MRDPIAVTGLGAISSLGTGVRAIADAMRDGRDGLSEMERVDVRPLHPIRFAGWIRERWERGETADLEAWSSLAAREAWDDARGAESGVPPERIAIVAGTTLGEEGAITRIAEAVAEAIGARGPRWTISTACSSSANAIGLGRDLILAGDADIVIAGGAEKLIREIFAGFAALGVLGAEKCAPFGETVGTTLGEGAGFVVLERAGAREVRAHGYLLGYALSSDAWHETTPDPRGEGIARATLGCLADAGLEPGDVDYVNAHATGTAANDDSEWRGIQRALGARATQIPISGSKGFLGHAQGAAGVLETIATLASMREGLVPPSLRVGRGRPRGPSDPVGETGRSRPGAIEVALSNSAAFGGANAVVAVSRSSRPVAQRAPRAVCVTGIGVVSASAGAARDDAEIARLCGDVDLRTTDPSSRMVIAATGKALRDAGVRVRGELRDRTGIFTGVSGPPRASIEEMQTSLERGLDRASAPAFARTVCHAPAGAASCAFGARGPATTVAGDRVAGLLAIAYAARCLRDRDDADRVVAGGLDERAIDGLEEEGAALVLLAADAAGPRIAGIATAPTAAEAIVRALSGAGLDASDIEAWSRPSTELAPSLSSASSVGSESSLRSAASSLRSALAFVTAVKAVREGARAAVASAEGPQGAVALVIVGAPAGDAINMGKTS